MPMFHKWSNNMVTNFEFSSPFVTQTTQSLQCTNFTIAGGQDHQSPLGSDRETPFTSITLFTKPF